VRAQAHFWLLPALAPVLLLGACSQEPDAPGPVATDVPKDVAGNNSPNLSAIESDYGTPVKERVATIALLNKRNDLQSELKLKPGESRRVGNVVVKLATCERTLPWERPADTGAFVQVYVEERARSNEPLLWRKVFSGWLFKNSPSLNAVEHPVYDVWVKDCAMKFPGEEEEASAAASTAAKPLGSVDHPMTKSPPLSGSTPSASATPRPTPTPE
jgi:hypothetical protein